MLTNRFPRAGQLVVGLAGLVKHAAYLGPVGATVLLWMLVTGRLMSMIAAGPIQASLAVLGSLSTIVGTGVVVWMVRRL